MGVVVDPANGWIVNDTDLKVDIEMFDSVTFEINGVIPACDP